MKCYLGLVDEDEVQEDYDLYIWFGHHCEKGIEWCQNNKKEYQIIDNDWGDNKYTQEVYNYLQEVKRSILEYISRMLNDYHDAEISKDGWVVLLSYWLDLFVTSYYDKYLKIIKYYNSENLCDVFLYENISDNMILDCIDYMKAAEDDEFHRYQYSRLIEIMSNDKGKLTVKNKGEYKRDIEFSTACKPVYVCDFEENHRNNKEVKESDDDVVIINPYIKFSLYKDIIEQNPDRISGYFLDYFSEVRKNIPVKSNMNWRKINVLERDYNADEFVDLMVRIIKLEIPIAYVEGFCYLKNVSNEYFKYAMKPNAIIFEASAILDNELTKMYLMNMRNKSTKLISVQHGGTQGLLKDYQHQFEYDVCDGIWSSGWISDTINAEKMPFVKYFRLKERNKIDDDIILYVSYSSFKNPIRLGYIDLKSGEYLQKERMLLNLLDINVKNQMFVRLYSNSYGWKYGERIREEIADLNFDIETDYYTSMLKSKLVIVELFQTTPMESIFMDIPTIAMYGPKYFSFWGEEAIEDDLKDVIKQLEKTDIIVGSPERLAEIVNTIADDVESWWMEPERQKAIQAYKDKYCYFPENAEQIWKEKIYSYVTN